MPNSQLYYRLVALWVFCEAFLGGIIHALKLPVSGLIVGSCAVCCICLVGHFVPRRGAVLQATFSVAVFKMLLSPQSPLPAYFAVFFQGLFGEILFLSRRFYILSCVLLGIIALTESGIQRILVMTLLYGKDFWTALNAFIGSFAGQNPMQPTDYAAYLAGAYILIHVFVGLLVGSVAAILPNRLAQWRAQYPLLPLADNLLEGNKMPFEPTKKQGRMARLLKNSFVLLWLALLLAYVQAYFQIGSTSLLPKSLLGGILLRALFLLLGWYFFLSPLLGFLLKKWLRYKQKQTQIQIIVENISVILPQIRAIATRAWQQTTALNGFARILVCLKIIVSHAVSEPPELPESQSE